MTTTQTAIADNNRCPMTAKDALWHYDLNNLEPEERIKLAALLAASAPNLETGQTAIATNALIDMRDNNRDAMEFLAESEAILNLVMDCLDSGDTDDENKRLAIKSAVGKIVNAANTLDTCLDFPLCRALGQ